MTERGLFFSKVRKTYCALQIFHIIYYQNYDNASASTGSDYLKDVGGAAKGGFFFDIKYKSDCFMTAPRSPAFGLFFFSHDAAQMLGMLGRFLESLRKYCSHARETF